MPAPTRVQYMTRLWNQRIQHGNTGHLPMQFDMANDRNDVLPGRTTGTRTLYENKKNANNGEIPYYTFDRHVLFNAPNLPIQMVAVRRGNFGPTVTPVGALAFVVLSNGEFRVAPPTAPGAGRFNHAHIADMATDVLYAGTISFGMIGGRRGVLDWWNNDSGAYRCPNAVAGVAGLPMARYQTPRWGGIVGPVGVGPEYQQ